jgi:hypothetical protein
MEIIDLVIDKIAAKKGESKDEVWNRFKKGFFDGSMMHLRDVEETFGKGSLRVFAHIGHYRTNNISEEQEFKANNLMRRYFGSDDDKERDKIARQIMLEREHLKYRQRKK